MQKPSSVTINLAKNRGETLVDRVIGFALTIGRVLIICTELVALGAFLYRFTLDQTLVGLHDTITQQEAVINLLRDNETKFRGVQDRLQTASILLTQSGELSTYLIDVESFAPSDMNIQNITAATDGIRVQATVQSVDSLTAFVNKLKAYPQVKSVSLDRIDNQTQFATIAFSVTALFKPSTLAPVNIQKAPGGGL